MSWDANTAAVIFEPDHMFLEDTIPSIEKAFQYGADVVESDIRVSKDNYILGKYLFC